MLYNKAKIKAWIKRQSKANITIDFENMLITDGYILIKIDDEVKKILDEMLITESVTIQNGKKNKNNMELNQILKNAGEYDLELADTKMLSILLYNTARIFLKQDGEHIYINTIYCDLIKNIGNQKMYAKKDYTAGVMIKDKNGEFLTLILPVRVPGPKYKVVLNEKQ